MSIDIRLTAVNYLYNDYDEKYKGTLYAKLINEFDSQLLNVVLTHCNGSQVKASKILGISRNTLRDKLDSIKKNTEISLILKKSDRRKEHEEFMTSVKIINAYANKIRLGE